MIHVFICDDNEFDIKYIKEIIMESIEDSLEVVFYEYTSGNEMIFDFQNRKQCDLLILDMLLGDMNGNDVAKKFREFYPYATLVFCSGLENPSIESFKTNPFRYIMKYDNEHMHYEMKKTFEEVVRQREDKCIVGHYRHRFVKVRIKNIMYITNAKRGSRIIVTPNCEEYRFEDYILIDEKLKDIQEMYEKDGFEFASSSYIVNMRYIKQLEKHELILDTDERLSVSRNYIKPLREKFINYYKHLILY